MENKHIKRFNEHQENKNQNISDVISNKNDGHLLIVHFESGDEIHLTILDINHLSTIEDFLDKIYSNIYSIEANDLCEYIENNTIDSIMCQTYVTMNYFQIQYNIKKVIHIAELGM
jgi:hypothetical protein